VECLTIIERHLTIISPEKDKFLYFQLPNNKQQQQQHLKKVF